MARHFSASDGTHLSLMTKQTSRRQFLTSTALGTAGALISGCTTYQDKPAKVERRLSPNDKLNIAMIGTANEAGWNLSQVAIQNIVALCDIDDRLLNAAGEKFL